MMVAWSLGEIAGAIAIGVSICLAIVIGICFVFDRDEWW